jgi:(p)ppGpp synthase/HD superfamily hydrolase
VNRYEALTHAVKAHAGQKDKCGRDYILHPIAVAEVLEREPHFHFESEIVGAILHDVREDTAYEVPGLNADEDAVLNALTRRPGEPYFNYIDRVCGSFYARQIKLADLWHNLQPERQSCLPEKERKSLEKRYLKARDLIWEALGYEWWPEPIEGTKG